MPQQQDEDWCLKFASIGKQSGKILTEPLTGLSVSDRFDVVYGGREGRLRSSSEGCPLRSAR